MKRIQLELGEEVTLTPESVDEGRFHHTGGTVVGQADEGERSLRLVAAEVGRARVSFGPDLSETLSPEERFRGAGATPKSHEVWEIEVVPKGGKTANQPASPLASSAVHEGLLPMSETQDGPSEKTPYGMDQENKPVAPHPSMTAGADTTNVARASETAEATGPKSKVELIREAEKDTPPEAKTVPEGPGEESAVGETTETAGLGAALGGAPESSGEGKSGEQKK